MEILREKCTALQIQKQLKNNDYSFCKEMVYTAQNYGLGPSRSRKTRSSYK